MSPTSRRLHLALAVHLALLKLTGADHFACDHTSPWAMPAAPPPDSVHALRPADVRVVAAMGDSQTAAFGAAAKTLAQQYLEPLEYRGYAWSVGGSKSYEENITTFPNILKMFTSELTGYATHDSIPIIRKNDSLDVAVSGDVAPGLPAQARRLVDRIKSDDKIDLEKDWKVITIWIGGNDQCRVCQENKTFSVAAYTANLAKAIDYLQASLPRTFINLVSYVDVQTCGALNSTSCQDTHHLVCPCMRNEEHKKMMHEVALQYQEAVRTLALHYSKHAAQDFTVVCQPFYEQFEFPRLEDGTPDYTYTAPDCFHYSVKGQSQAGKALWNSMMQPVGAKTPWRPPTPLVCPTKEQQYFATIKNGAIAF